MEMAKENLCINKVVYEKKEIIFAESDMIIPDAKPDILKAICTSGMICLYKKEIMDERLRLDGSINTYIMYLTEDEKDNVRGINTSLDFSENITLSNCTSNMCVEVKTCIKSIECKVINGRKINIKATIEVNVKVYSSEDVEIVNNMEDAENIQMLKESLKVNSMLGTGNTKIYGKETIPIDNIDSIAEILKANMNIVDKDVKMSYNKVLTKAEAEVRVMYLTEESRINTVNARVPVVGFIDIPNVTEDNICDTNYEIKNIILKPNPQEEHSIYIEIEIEVSCVVYEDKEINLIQDVYSPCENLEFNQKQITAMADKRSTKQVNPIREKVNVEEMDNKDILDVDVNPVISKEEQMNNKIMYDGELEITFILSDRQDGKIDKKSIKIPFNYTIDEGANQENSKTTTEVEVGATDFIIQNGGDVSCNIDMLFNTNTNKTANLNMIDDIRINGQRDEQDYSVVIYIVKKGDTLWKIAKKFGSTIEEISRANGLEDENRITPGQKLFITRYRRREPTQTEVPMATYV